MRYENVEAVLSDIGRCVKELRKARGLTQAQIAARLEMSTQRVQFIEAGKANLRMTTLITLANVFDCPLDAFLQTPTKHPGETPTKRATSRKKHSRRR